MKKTIIINIGNSIIHIEEEAYEVLTTYLNEIKAHFAKSVDDFEIVKDIENRIAEMFAEVLAANQLQVITMADVEQVITQMGRVQDFSETEEFSAAVGEMPLWGEKKLFRDPDDARIAGVCSGLSYYLNLQVSWVRLIALLTIFLGGAGVIAYIILWIAMPGAITRSEKMEMKGELTNLYGYKKAYEEELAGMGGGMQQRRRQGNFITEIFTALGNAFNTMGRFFSKTLATIIIIFGFIILIGLIISLAAFLGFWDSETYSYFPLSVVNPGYRGPLAFTAFIILFIPVLALVLFSIRVAFNRMTINKFLSFGLLIIWLGGVSIGVYYAAKISSEFKEHAELEQSTELQAFNTYILNADYSMVLTQKDSLDYQIGGSSFKDRIIVDDAENHPFREPRNVHVHIEKSENGKTTLVQNFESQGKTFQVALENAKNIAYKFTQEGKVLTFSPRVLLPDNANWRNQSVHLTLKVPVGTRLMINDNLNDYLYFYYYHCEADQPSQGAYHEWVMTADGLKCQNDIK